MAKSPAWTRKEGKNPSGGLNEKGRASAKAHGMNLKPIWEKKLPADHKSKPMKAHQIKQAKAKARAAGRPYPNAVDNIAVARSKGK